MSRMNAGWIGSGVADFERRFGEIDRIWTHDAAGDPLAFAIVRHRGAIGGRSVVYCTFGASSLGAPSPRGRMAFHEYVVLVDQDSRQDWVPDVLHKVGLAARLANRAWGRGDVAGPVGPLAEMSKLEALYVTAPFFLDEALHVIERAQRRVEILWLVPIAVAEAELLATFGPAALETELERNLARLADLDREPLTRSVRH